METSNHHQLIVVFFVLFALVLGTNVRVGAECGGQDCKQAMLAMTYTSTLSSGIKWQSEPHTTDVATQRIDWALSNPSIFKSTWTRDWGPVIDFEDFEDPDSLCPLSLISAPGHKIPANTLFVGKNGSEYVLAVAGTNSKSRYDLCKEDLTYGLTAWPSQSDVSVTKGTLKGLQILQGMKDPKKLGLVTYLKSIVTDGPVTIYVTGHSLGGALAPALALWLKEQQSQWDPKSNATLKIYAFAGATPGDQTFKDYLDPKFPGDNMVIVNNTRDMVPHAWNYDTFIQIKGLYTDEGIKVCGGAFDCGTADLLNFLPPFLEGKKYATLGTSSQQQPITGKLIAKTDFPGSCSLFYNTEVGPDKCQNWSGDDCDCDSGTCARLDGPVSAYYGAELLYQHICAYPNKLGSPDLNTILCQCRQKFDPAVQKDCPPSSPPQGEIPPPVES